MLNFNGTKIPNEKKTIYWGDSHDNQVKRIVFNGRSVWATKYDIILESSNQSLGSSQYIQAIPCTEPSAASVRSDSASNDYLKCFHGETLETMLIDVVSDNTVLIPSGSYPVTGNTTVYVNKYPFTSYNVDSQQYFFSEYMGDYRHLWIKNPASEDTQIRKMYDNVMTGPDGQNFDEMYSFYLQFGVYDMASSVEAPKNLAYLYSGSDSFKDVSSSSDFNTSLYSQKPHAISFSFDQLKKIMKETESSWLCFRHWSDWYFSCKATHLICANGYYVQKASGVYGSSDGWDDYAGDIVFPGSEAPST